MSKYSVGIGVKHWQVFDETVEADSEEQAFSIAREQVIRHVEGRFGMADHAVIKYHVKEIDE